MSTNHNNQELDANLICEYFLATERQGPGSPEATIKALSFIEPLPDEARIADLGCGTGGQTMVLARHLSGTVTGIDSFPGFIERFNREAKRMQLHDRVRGVVGSMDDLSFGEEELDLIWSEGAIYNIGFEWGLNEWRKYLKSGGYVAVTEISWLTDERPEEIHRFWVDAYPEIDTIPTKTAQMQKAGYVPVATFVLPESCWRDYFRPQRKAQEAFLKKYPDHPVVEELVASMRQEETLYDRYKDFYGYVFYIGRKR